MRYEFTRDEIEPPMGFFTPWYLLFVILYASSGSDTIAEKWKHRLERSSCF